MENKRFYWIKLKTDFFNQEAIDFLMAQENGCQYIVLYQMLCLKTANNNGLLSTQIGEMLVPYDVKKIARDTKYFDIDTVTIALELFKRLGLIYEESNEILCITNITEMIGSEAGNANAQRQKRFREQEKRKSLSVTKSVTKSNGSNVTENNEEYRDKSIEVPSSNEEVTDVRYAHSSDSSDEESSSFAPLTCADAPSRPAEVKSTPAKVRLVIPPALEDVRAYCLKRKNNIDPEQFIDYYQQQGWRLSNGLKMTDWQASVRTWEKREEQKIKKANTAPEDAFDYEEDLTPAFRRAYEKLGLQWAKALPRICKSVRDLQYWYKEKRGNEKVTKRNLGTSWDGLRFSATSFWESYLDYVSDVIRGDLPYPAHFDPEGKMMQSWQGEMEIEL